jgi:hypothetical protein
MVQAVDFEKLRIALRRMSRDNLLIVAERAAELVPRAKLRVLVGDLVRLDGLAAAKPGPAPLLDEVRKFHAASRRGEYYDSFDVNSKNFMESSEGTDAFIAEFDRLVGRCIRAAETAPRAPVREAFERLFGLLRRIDEGRDDVVFFADEGGSWSVGVDWHRALFAYFRCLAESASAEDFAREVDRAIADFADYERPRHLAAARRAANAEQKAALRRLPVRERRPRRLHGTQGRRRTPRQDRNGDSRSRRFSGRPGH